MGLRRFSILLIMGLLCACQTAQKTVQLNQPHSLPYYPLRTAQDLEVLVDAIGNSKIVLLGESSHGTHEFYSWRAALTKKLVEEKGFSFMAIEGDWVDTYKVNEFIKGPLADSTQAVATLRQYDRWPSWMWGNHEFAELVSWLHRHNQNKVAKVGLFGLDVYSFWEWITPDADFGDPAVNAAAQSVYDCFITYNHDALKYAGAVQMKKAGCPHTTEKLWHTVKELRAGNKIKDDQYFLLEQKAFLAFNGERYFRTMVSDRAASWNIRDAHMAETVNRLLQQHGRNARAIIWAHNGHAGDARFSDMSTAGYSSLGEMLRRQWPGQTFSVGFGTYSGTVMAGYQWNGPMQVVKVPPAKDGSWEAMLHGFGADDKIILSSEIAADPRFNKWIEFRAIGAVFGEWAVYGRSVMPKRFDAFVYLDNTTVVTPISR